MLAHAGNAALDLPRDDVGTYQVEFKLISGVRLETPGEAPQETVATIASGVDLSVAFSVLMV